MIHQQSKKNSEKNKRNTRGKRSKIWAQKHFNYYQKNLDETCMCSVFYHELNIQKMGVFQQCFYGHIWGHKKKKAVTILT